MRPQSRKDGGLRSLAKRGPSEATGRGVTEAHERTRKPQQHQHAHNKRSLGRFDQGDLQIPLVRCDSAAGVVHPHGILYVGPIFMGFELIDLDTYLCCPPSQTSSPGVLLLGYALSIQKGVFAIPAPGCSGRGSLSPEGGCRCPAGWGGLACEQVACKAHGGLACGGHGDCIAGFCLCERGWSGDDCSREALTPLRCPNGCWGVGECDVLRGKCVCPPGYSGIDCSRGLCPRDCSGHGRCVAGVPSSVGADDAQSNRLARRLYVRRGLYWG